MDVSNRLWWCSRGLGFTLVRADTEEEARFTAAGLFIRASVLGATFIPRDGSDLDVRPANEDEIETWETTMGQVA